ncbi:Chs5p-Arf1p-binding proteins-domain-containing protein [Syncephalis fuscata]|nr:Chs5p-Arf1p-binding proteins-domain-containing protein [Syncephalis fuscata]
MSDALKDVPEFFESVLGESVIARTDAIGSFRELGPPDLCHLTKKQGKEGQEISLGSYHHVSGVDASTMASLAAYINTLTYSQNEQQGWFGKSNSQWRITSAVYCCYNAFSRVDMRVIVKIPGSVECFMIDSYGRRQETTPELWSETYMSALLRAILYSDDYQYRLSGFRRFDPIPTMDSEQRFLDVTAQLYHKGWQLGTEAEIQIATNSRNHLTSGLMKYFSQSGRYHVAVKAFEQLFNKDPEAGSLLAEAYIGMDEEIRGVQVLHDALLKKPSSYSLLHIQVDFLRTKGKYELACQLAKRAVNCAPSEFVTWAKLTEIYTDLGNFKAALLTMNSCPMFTFTDRDLPRAPTPARAHAITKPDALTEGNDDDMEPLATQEPSQRLPASMLRGTFARAYGMLTQLAFKIGWEELLHSRSSVFVMEDEYRMIKHEERGDVTVMMAASDNAPEKGKDTVTDNGAGITTKTEEPVKEDTEKVETKTTTTLNDDNKSSNEDMEEVPLESAATSPETANEQLSTPVATLQVSQDIDLTPENTDTEQDTKETTRNDGEHDNKNVVTTGKSIETSRSTESLIKRPKGAAEGPLDEEDNDGNTKEKSNKIDVADQLKTVNQAGGPLSSKRLCERWLDNLFMVLYEDLRAYAAWQMEMARHKEENVPYLRSAADWEALGDLALRLHHKDAAREAYVRCLRNKFSLQAWTRLLELYIDTGDALKALEVIVQLAIYHDSQYNEVSYPMPITHALNRLVRTHGMSKVKNMLVSMNLSLPIQRLVARYLGYVKAFHVEGWDL